MTSFAVGYKTTPGAHFSLLSSPTTLIIRNGFHRFRYLQGEFTLQGPLILTQLTRFNHRSCRSHKLGIVNRSHSSPASQSSSPLLVFFSREDAALTCASTSSWYVTHPAHSVPIQLTAFTDRLGLHVRPRTHLVFIPGSLSFLQSVPELFTVRGPSQSCDYL
jgi:hypothetical protein